MADRQPALPKFLTSFNPWLIPIGAILLMIVAPIVAANAWPTLDWAPGIPLPGQPSRQAFDDAFWPQLYSGVIAGAVTGLAIGVALFVAQLKVESNRARRAHCDAVAGFFGNIERYARARNRVDYIPWRAAAAAPYGAALVEDEAYDKPLNVWWELCPDYRNSLYHVWFLRQSYFDFGVAARIADSAYDVAARQYLQSRGSFDEEEVQAIRRYAIAKILGADMDVIHVTTAGAMSSTELAEAFDAIMQQPSYEHVATNYRNVLNAVEFALGALAPSVATIPDSSETDASTQEQTDNHAGG